MVLFFWIVDMLIPIIMIVFGLVSKNKPPKNINSLYGYRTPHSMRSQKTWDYAHKRIGDIWPTIGIVLAVLVFISKLFMPIEKEYLSLIHAGLGLFALIVSIPFIEKELKTKFDKNGNPSTRIDKRNF